VGRFTIGKGKNTPAAGRTRPVTASIGPRKRLWRGRTLRSEDDGIVAPLCDEPSVGLAPVSSVVPFRYVAQPQLRVSGDEPFAALS
jgi:hypothetical protein